MNAFMRWCAAIASKLLFSFRQRWCCCCCFCWCLLANNGIVCLYNFQCTKNVKRPSIVLNRFPQCWLQNTRFYVPGEYVKLWPFASSSSFAILFYLSRECGKKCVPANHKWCVIFVGNFQIPIIIIFARNKFSPSIERAREVQTYNVYWFDSSRDNYIVS